MGENTKPQMGPWQGRDWLQPFIINVAKPD